MHIKLIVLLLSFVIIGQHSSAQNYYKDFLKACETNDTLKQKELLNNWQANEPQNPELFTCLYNYYVHKSKEEIIKIEDTPKEDTFALLKEGTEEVVGYLNSDIGYNSTYLDSAFHYIDKGISMHPDRLDMRFGKIYVLGQIGAYKDFTNNIIKTIDHSAINNNKWLWTENTTAAENGVSCIDGIQEYINTLYNTGNNDDLPYIEQISNTVLKYYPKRVESLTNIAVVKLINKDYDNALTYLKKAETYAPDDMIVKGNIAEAYKRMKDTDNARKYYKIMLDKGNEQDQAFAKQQLEHLE